MMVDAGHLAAIIPGGNGMFQSTIVRGGRAVAVWTRALTRTGVTASVEPLIPLTVGDRDRVGAALQPYADYLGLPLTVKIA